MITAGLADDTCYVGTTFTVSLWAAGFILFLNTLSNVFVGSKVLREYVWRLFLQQETRYQLILSSGQKISTKEHSSKKIPKIPPYDKVQKRIN